MDVLTKTSDDVFKRKDENIFKKNTDNIFKKNAEDILAQGGDKDIFSNPGYQTNVFPGDENREPVQRVHRATPDVLYHYKFRTKRVKVIQRTLDLYMKVDEKSQKTGGKQQKSRGKQKVVVTNEFD